MIESGYKIFTWIWCGGVALGLLFLIIKQANIAIKEKKFGEWLAIGIAGILSIVGLSMAIYVFFIIFPKAIS